MSHAHAVSQSRRSDKKPATRKPKTLLEKIGNLIFMHQVVVEGFFGNIEYEDVHYGHPSNCRKCKKLARDAGEDSSIEVYAPPFRLSLFGWFASGIALIATIIVLLRV